MIMERLLSPDMVAEIMSISRRSAYTLMHSIPHIEQPLRVKEKELQRYIESKTVYPMPIGKRKRA